MKLENSKTKIISILMLIVLLFNFMSPLKSNAVPVSILTKPLCTLGVLALDMVNLAGTALFVRSDSEYDELEKELNNDEEKSDITWGDIQTGYYNLLMSPDKIFAGKIALLNANIFRADGTGSHGLISTVTAQVKTGVGSELAGVLKKSVASIYVVLRNMCAVVLLCLLIFTGIKILISSASPYQQARWKEYLLDWVKAICLLMLMHYLMVGIFYISDLLVYSLGKGWGELSIVAFIRIAFKNTGFWDGTGCILYLIMYAYVTYLSIVFFISYFKRLIWTIVLICISPVVATVYAIGNNGKQIFKSWFTEYMHTVLIQPFHMLIFYILIILPLGINSGGGTLTTTVTDKLIGTNSSSIAMQLYTLISMAMIKPASQFLAGLFGFKGNGAKVASQASIESGEKTGRKIVETAVDITKFVGMTAAAVATGGAALAAGGAAAAAGGAAAAGEGAAVAEGATAIEGAEGLEAIEGAGEAEEAVEALDAGDMFGDDDLMISSDPFHDGYSDWYLNDDPASENLTPEPHMMNEEELQEELDHLGLEGEDREAMEKDLREAGHGGQLGEGNGETDESINENNSEKLEEAANKLEEAANKLEENGDEDDKKSLWDKLQERKEKRSEALNYMLSDEGKDGLYNIASDFSNLAGDLYIDGEQGDFKVGLISQIHGKEEERKKKSKERLESYVNNEENINYMIKEHNLLDTSKIQEAREEAKEKYKDNPALQQIKVDQATKEANESAKSKAKEMLKGADPYLSKGITNVQLVDHLMTLGADGKAPETVIKNFAQAQNYINNSSSVKNMQQVIAKETGKSVNSKEVMSSAKATVRESGKYIERGVDKNPEVLSRLVRLENELKRNVGKGNASVISAKQIIGMDKALQDAMKKGLKEIPMPKVTGIESIDQKTKKINDAANKELKTRYENLEKNTKKSKK